MARILIVDDEHQISSRLETFFQRSGFETTIVSNGEQALQIAQTDDYDVILLDLKLPLKDGWTVLRELREQGNQTPVIVITASFIAPEELLKMGANDCVEKPFKFRDLLTTVRRQIEP